MSRRKLMNSVFSIFLLLCCSVGWNEVFGVRATTTPEAPAHVVVVIMSSRDYNQIIGNSDAPFINGLLQRGVLFSDYHGMDPHFTQPNYMYLFSGSSQRVTTDSYPATGPPFNVATLYSTMSAAGLTFVHQSESLPSNGYTGVGEYPCAPYHNAAASFANITAAVNVPFNEALLDRKS